MRHIRRAARTGIVLAAIVLLLIAAGSASASPVADKKARLREVQARLETIRTQVTVAVERYNQAVSRLDSTRGKIQQNQRRLTAAQQNLELANRQLAARAQDIYKTPETGFADIVFSARSFDDLVAQFDLMQRLGNSDVDLVRSVAAYERDIKDRRVELKADEATAVTLLAETQTNKSAILTTEARMNSLESGLQADIKAALAAQAAAARAAARAATRAATQQAAAAASSASGLDGRTTGGPSLPDPGGPGHPEVVAIAQRYLGIPYVWGGASPKGGFDCSGLTMYVYAQIGISMAHGATLQQQASKPVPLNALLPGDLVFYGNASFSSHVAIYAGGGQVIEAPYTGAVVSYDAVGSAWIGGRF